MKTITSFKLPKEYAELNKLIHEFNTGLNVKLFGEGYYLLLQGSRVKSYSIYLVDEKQGKRIVNAYVMGANKKEIINAIDLLSRLTMPKSQNMIQR